MGAAVSKPDTRRIRLFRRATLGGLAVALFAYAALSIASYFDASGFNSNRDFYFHVRHPVRFAVLNWAMWLSLFTAIVGGIAWIWTFLKR